MSSFRTPANFISSNKVRVGLVFALVSFAAAANVEIKPTWSETQLRPGSGFTVEIRLLDLETI